MKMALLLVDHGSVRAEANALLAEVARLVREISGVEIVEHAHMELAEPTIVQGFDACVAAGANMVIVHPYFLAPGRHSTQDIPRLAAGAAARHPGVRYSVTEPLGLHAKIVEVVLERAAQAGAGEVAHGASAQDEPRVRGNGLRLNKRHQHRRRASSAGQAKEARRGRTQRNRG